MKKISLKKKKIKGFHLIGKFHDTVLSSLHSIYKTSTLKLKQQNGIQPSLFLLFTAVLFLLEPRKTLNSHSPTLLLPVGILHPDFIPQEFDTLAGTFKVCFCHSFRLAFRHIFLNSHNSTFHCRCHYSSNTATEEAEETQVYRLNDVWPLIMLLL